MTHLLSSIRELDDYQSLAYESAVYPGVGEGSTIALTYLGLGLGEAGEIQGKLKKVLRDDAGVLTAEKRDALLDEVGDLLWYVAMLTNELGCNLSEVATRNIEKLHGRLERGTIQGSGDHR